MDHVRNESLDTDVAAADTAASSAKQYRRWRDSDCLQVVCENRVDEFLLRLALH